MQYLSLKKMSRIFFFAKQHEKKINYVQHCLSISHLWWKSHAFACVRCSSHGILFSSANLDWWKILHQEFLFCLLIIKLLFHIMCLSYLCLLLLLPLLFLPVHSFKSFECSASTETKLFHNGEWVSEWEQERKERT